MMKSYEIDLSPKEFSRHIRGCARNKRKSQKKIYRSFYKHAIEICDANAISYDETKEILNEGFLKIFTQIINYSPACTNEMTSFLNWLRTIMIHTAIDHHKKSSRRHVIPELGRPYYYQRIVENRCGESLHGMNE